MNQHTRGRALSPLFGRAAEVQQLAACWERARSGAGNTVLISGEAGIGKSRLAAEAEDRARSDRALIMRFQCSALRSNRDLYPVQDYVTRVVGADPSDPGHVRRHKITIMLARSGLGAPPDKLLSSLLALGEPADCSAITQSPQRQREDVFSALIDGVADLAQVKPLLVIVEDAQWLDPTSGQLLERLAGRAPLHRLLIVVTARRDFDPAWIGTAHTSVVVPRRLSAGDAAALAMHTAGKRQLTPAELQRAVDRSEGVPLFVEELSKHGAVAGTPAPDAVPLPADLHALLIPRLERVGPALELAQIASALGRRFSHAAATLVLGADETAFADRVAELMAAEFLLTKPIEQTAHYSFRHALLQEAAYASLNPDERIAVHAKIVVALNSLSGDMDLRQPEITAHHCDCAEFYGAAARHWLAAGKAAAARGAVIEAVTFLDRGRASAERSSPGDQRSRSEFELNMALGPALMALEGYASGEALAAFERARKLRPWSQSSLEDTHVLLGLFNVHFGRAEFVQALDVANQADQFLSVGYRGYPVLRGQTYCMMGRFVDARRSLEQALAQYNPAIDANSGLFARADVVATMFLAKVEFSLGNLDRCTELTAATMTLARQQGHPVALAIAYLGQLFLATEAGDLAHAQSIADEALAHATEHNLDNYRLWVTFHRAALSLRTNPSVALATMDQILAEADDSGTRTFRAAQLGLLGAAYASIGRTDEALALIDEGLATARRTQALEAMPALHRLRGRILAATHPAEAILALETSLAMAREQSARVEEVRSATVLARILKDTGRGPHAKEMLAAAYATFTQGHGFPDLQHARRVLASLAETK